MRTVALSLALALTAAPLASAQPGARPSWMRPAAAIPSDPSLPLPPELRRIAEEVPDEGTPSPSEHYPVSNEHRHDLWFAHIRDLGGAFVGVGTDQCYTLAAVQNAQLVWIVDFDPIVPLVHRIYGVLVPLSDDPSALVDRFSPERSEETEGLLREHLGADPAPRPSCASTRATASACTPTSGARTATWSAASAPRGCPIPSSTAASARSTRAAG
ncbi:MAG: hypothetical protein M5U28_02895 [Sandaracinaceae bacterium]|nr:hypothetical protein [Sandaracinaceae bacterium]